MVSGGRPQSTDQKKSNWYPTPLPQFRWVADRDVGLAMKTAWKTKAKETNKIFP